MLFVELWSFHVGIVHRRPCERQQTDTCISGPAFTRLFERRFHSCEDAPLRAHMKAGNPSCSEAAYDRKLWSGYRMQRKAEQLVDASLTLPSTVDLIIWTLEIGRFRSWFGRTNG